MTSTWFDTLQEIKRDDKCSAQEAADAARELKAEEICQDGKLLDDIFCDYISDPVHQKEWQTLLEHEAQFGCGNLHGTLMAAIEDHMT